MALHAIDTSILLLVNNGFSNGLFDMLMPFLSAYGYLLVIPFLAYQLGTGAVRRDREGQRYVIAAVWAILIACVAAYLAGGTEYLMKNAVGRIRPCRSVEGLRLIVSCPQSFSMPSGHAITSFAFAFPLYYLSRDYLPFAARLYPLLLASAIASSRIYLGVHYPSDVLVGAFLGVLIALALSNLYRATLLRMHPRGNGKEGKVS